MPNAALGIQKQDTFNKLQIRKLSTRITFKERGDDDDDDISFNSNGDKNSQPAKNLQI